MTTGNQYSQHVHAIIVAAGKGERSGLALPKQFHLVDGVPMIRHSAEQFLKHDRITKLWIVIGSGQEQMLSNALEGLSNFETVIGGNTRQQSVLNGLLAIDNMGGCDQVLIHDAARPFVNHDMINMLCETLVSNSAAIPVLAAVDTMIESSDNRFERVLDRDQLKRVQTPQAFQFDLLLAAHETQQSNVNATDDAQIFRAAGHEVVLVEGDERLKKYTNANDFIEGTDTTMIRTGMGFDVHQLGTGEELWLGGVKIDHEKGLIGHSDADVLLHALTDALLGAVGGGDIGDHFPPSDSQWKGASSDVFVKFAAQFIAEKGGLINNVDMTLMCEAPKIKPHRENIRQNIAHLLEISLDQVSVKATTTEGLGFTGRGEGIAAQAIATISTTGNHS